MKYGQARLTFAGHTGECDSLKAVHYQDYLLRDVGQDPMVACTGDNFTHNCTSDWLRDVLTNLTWPAIKGRSDRVLELMSGIGRNFPVLSKRFK